MRSSNVRALAEVLLPQGGREASTTVKATPRIWFHSSCLTSTGAGEEVDEKEFLSIAEHVKAIYETV